MEYVSYTNRVPITQEFWPSEDEQKLYDMVSEYLRGPSSRLCLQASAPSWFGDAQAAGFVHLRDRRCPRRPRPEAASGSCATDDKAGPKLAEQLDEAFEADFEELPEVADEWESRRRR